MTEILYSVLSKEARMADTVVLKKYPNRRLYDTDKSMYVTLPYVAEMIKNGVRVDVVDAKTGEDVTAFILHQIILEEAKMNHRLLPTSLLHLIIQYGDTALREFFEKYLQQTIENYLTYKSASDEQFRKWLAMGTDLSEVATKTMTGMMTPYTTLLNLFPPPEEGKEEKEKQEKQKQKQRQKEKEG